jgi:hypothetical protein
MHGPHPKPLVAHCAEDRDGSPACQGTTAEEEDGAEERLAEQRKARGRADALHHRRRQLLKQLHSVADGVGLNYTTLQCRALCRAYMAPQVVALTSNPI